MTQFCDVKEMQWCWIAIHSGPLTVLSSSLRAKPPANCQSEEMLPLDAHLRSACPTIAGFIIGCSSIADSR